jgi:DNA-binding winged helix-turn-helix (wHTH) protein/predicted ATPase
VSADRAYRFGRFRLHPAQGLLRGARRIAVTPKALAVLRTLVERGGQIVTKEEIFRAVWTDSIVSDAALTTCIQELRRALQDDAHAPRYIETQHRRGFTFVAPVDVEPLNPAAAPASAARTAALTEPFVGRQSALAQLSDALERARSGIRQIVFVSGEAGIGKTSVLERFLASLDSHGNVRVCRADCVEHYGAGEAYQPLLEALTRLCRLPDGANSIACLRRYAPSWLAQLPALQTPAELSALRRQTAGVRPERMLRELTDALEAMAAAGPIVLCIEDLHWSDVSTLDWIASFAHRPERAAVLLVCTTRTGEAGEAARSTQGIATSLRARDLCIDIALTRLDAPSVNEYVERRFPPTAGASESIGRLATLVHSHSDGNPLFVVNILNDLVTRNVLVGSRERWTVREDLDSKSLGVPADMRRTIERRIERLDAFDRQLLEVASILPASCSAAAIAAGADVPVAQVEETLGALARHGAFVREAGVAEWPDATMSSAFEFLHALYREVLSDRLSPSRRAELHRSIGARLETAYRERAPEIAAELAIHFEQARDLQRAVVYLQHAAETDNRRNAHAGAQGHFRRALSLIERLPESAERDARESALLVGLGTVLMQLHGWSAPEVEQAYTRARDLSSKHGALEQKFSANWNLWVAYLARGRVPQSQELAGTLFDLGKRSTQHSMLLQGHHACWTTSFSLGNLADAIAHARDGLQVCESEPALAQTQAFGGHDTMMCARTFLARSAALSGMPVTAKRCASEAVARARQIGHPFTLAMSLAHAAAVNVELRDAATAYPLATEAAELAREQSFSLMLGWATSFLGAALIERGELGDGLALIHEGIDQARSTGAVMFRAHFLTLLARAQLQGACFVDAQRTLDEALQLTGVNGERTYAAEVHRLNAELALASRTGADSRRLAERDLQTAIDIAIGQGSSLLALRAAISLARLRSQDDSSLRLVAAARGRFTEDSELPELTAADALLSGGSGKVQRSAEQIGRT